MTENNINQSAPDVVEKQPCPMCNKNALVLTESAIEVPFFGKMYVFSMHCNECHYHKADVEAQEKKKKSKYTLNIETEEDMKIRIVKSSEATVKIPHLITVTPGSAANGYITNVEGVLNRIKHVIEGKASDLQEDKEIRKKAKNQLKKLRKVMSGNEELKLIIEDPTGNSAIISEKAIKN